MRRASGAVIWTTVQLGPSAVKHAGSAALLAARVRQKRPSVPLPNQTFVPSWKRSACQRRATMAGSLQPSGEPDLVGRLARCESGRVAVDKRPLRCKRTRTDAQGARSRARYTDELKRQVVAEATAEGASVAGVARRHGLNGNLVFGWRHRRGRPNVQSDQVGPAPSPRS